MPPKQVKLTPSTYFFLEDIPMKCLPGFAKLNLLSFGFFSFFCLYSTLGYTQISDAQIRFPWFPNTVEDLQVDKYIGKWYEVASTKPRFQEDCFCITAEYKVLAEDELEVINTCRLSGVDGELDVATGTARIPDLDEKSKLNVNFGGIRLPFTNYWIIEVGQNYEYAVVSSPFRNPIWILSREPSLPEETIASIKERLEEDFFNTSNITPSIQEGCTY